MVPTTAEPATARGGVGWGEWVGGGVAVGGVVGRWERCGWGQHLRSEGSFWLIMNIPVSIITRASCCKQTSVSVFTHLCMLRGW